MAYPSGHPHYVAPHRIQASCRDGALFRRKCLESTNRSAVLALQRRLFHQPADDDRIAHGSSCLVAGEA